MKRKWEILFGNGRKNEIKKKNRFPPKEKIMDFFITSGFFSAGVKVSKK